MELGLKRDEVRLVEYTDEWNEEFIRIKKELVNYTELDADRIEHIGSTAIRGMSAKPVIDILIGVDNYGKLNKSFFKALQRSGFLRLKVERDGEIVLAKFTDETYMEKTHFVHLVNYKDEIWNHLIFFRDYLNTHESARKDYLEIKEKYLSMSSRGINEYTDYKESFVHEILEQKTT